jgi:DNA-binding transcriptional ArsR family regulator
MSVDIAIVLPTMTGTDYKDIIGKLNGKVVALRMRRTEIEVELAEIDTEISNIKAAVSKLLPLIGESSEPDNLSGLGFTDAVRRILKLADGKHMTAGEIQKALGEKGFDLSGYSVPIASIYKILVRLYENGEVEREKEGSTVLHTATSKLLAKFEMPMKWPE